MCKLLLGYCIYVDSENKASNGVDVRVYVPKGKKDQGMFGEAKAGNMLIDLRKAANHPLLFRRLYNDSNIDALVRDYSKTEDYTGEPLAHTREDFQTNSDAELCMSIAMHDRLLVALHLIGAQVDAR